MRARLALFYVLAVAGCIADQWTKNIVFDALQFDYVAWLSDFTTQYSHIRSIQVVPGILSWESGINTGISWSLLRDNNSIFIVVMAVAILGMLAITHLMQKRHGVAYWALGFILAGATGNFIDRIRYHGVRDFVHVDLFPFPLFNLADTWITIGAALIIFYLVFEHKLDPQLFPKETPATDAAAAPDIQNSSTPGPTVE